jgi:hypothetical protein
MEINVTKFFRDAPDDMCAYSGNRMEHGSKVAEITWHNACEAAQDFNLLDTEEKRDAFRRDLKDMGFSEADDDHSDAELNALLIQCIAADIRESGLDTSEPDWDEYREGTEAGRYSGRLFVADCGDCIGDIFYQLGS